MSDQSIRDGISAFLQGLGLTDKPAEFGDGIHGWRCEHPDRYGPCDCFAQAITDLLASPVIRRIQAEAWDEGFDAHDQDWKHHDANNWGDEDCIDATYNPYRKES